MDTRNIDYKNGFTISGKKKFERLLAVFNKLPVICPQCFVDTKDYAKGLISCDFCNNWFHFKCANLKFEPIGEWFCDKCQKHDNRSN